MKAFLEKKRDMHDLYQNLCIVVSLSCYFLLFSSFFHLVFFSILLCLFIFGSVNVSNERFFFGMYHDYANFYMQLKL
jgi:hypothetical protein